MITHNKIIKAGITLMLSFLMAGCLEPIEIVAENFEDILVVDALITDELKRQEILLSRTFRFGDDSALPEKEAIVSIKDNLGNEFVFEEVEDGRYLSELEFQAVFGREYQMSIQTNDDQEYTSDNVLFQQESSLDNLYVTRKFNGEGVEGVGIFIDTFDPSGNSRYYRFEYEETYRYEAERWIDTDIVATTLDDGTISVTLVERPLNKRICYIQNSSNEKIILNNTIRLEEDRINGFEIKFIDSGDMSIADRYSILVRQYVQSREAHAFYESLSDFDESENFLTQVQPGFINGNINVANDSDNKVIGYFEVSSVSEKRIFFNHDDVLGDLPEFTIVCEPTVVELESPLEPIENYLIRVEQFVNNGNLVLATLPLTSVESGASVVLVPRACGDCTEFGSGEVPDFWTD